MPPDARVESHLAFAWRSPLGGGVVDTAARRVVSHLAFVFTAAVADDAGCCRQTPSRVTVSSRSPNATAADAARRRVESRLAFGFTFPTVVTAQGGRHSHALSHVTAQVRLRDSRQRLGVWRHRPPPGSYRRHVHVRCDANSDSPIPGWALTDASGIASDRCRETWT